MARGRYPPSNQCSEIGWMVGHHQALARQLQGIVGSHRVVVHRAVIVNLGRPLSSHV